MGFLDNLKSYFVQNQKKQELERQQKQNELLQKLLEAKQRAKGIDVPRFDAVVGKKQEDTGVKRVVNNVKSNVKSFVKQAPINAISPLAKFIPSKFKEKTYDEIIKQGRELLQSTPRTFMGYANNIRGEQQFTPKTGFEKAVLGTEPVKKLFSDNMRTPSTFIKSLGKPQDTNTQGADFLKSFGAKESTAGKYGNLAGLGLLASELPGFKQAKGLALGAKGLKEGELALKGAKGLKTFIKGAEEFNPQAYIKEIEQAQKAARGGKIGNAFAKTKDIYKEIKSKLVDSNAPIEDTLREASKKGKFEILKKYNISNQINRVLKAPDIAGAFAKENGLVDIIKKTDNLSNLDQYMLAKHSQDLAQQGVETGRNLIKDQKLIGAFSKQYEPIAKEVVSYSHKILDTATEGGLISKDLATKLKTQYPNYVPMQRVFSELEKGNKAFGTSAVASFSKQSVVQKIKGSKRAIESPIESLMAKTNDVVEQVEKNKAAQMLTSYEALPGNPFGLRKLETGESAPHTISTFRNGVKEVFEVNPDIERAAKNLNKEQIGLVGRILALPVRIGKAGITGLNPAFVAANVVKDQLFSVVTSKVARKTAAVANPINFGKALFSAIGHGKLYDEVVAQGAMSTSFDIARDQLPQTVARIRSNKNVASKIAYTVRHPGELLRTVENIIGRSEELTRIQQYAGTKQAALKAGRTAQDAQIIAAEAARENTANFSRSGEWGRALNGAVMYLNASIQGSRSLIRAFKSNPVGTGTKIATTILLPSAIITSYNLSDPERKKVYEDIPEYEKETNLILIPPNAKKDETTGKYNVIKIPLPPGLSNFTSLVRRPIEAAQGLDPVKFMDIANSVMGLSPVNLTRDNKFSASSIASTLLPQAVKPTIEAITNKDMFTGNSIVSKKYEGLSKELQVKPNTSGTARIIGGKLGTSPIKTENFVKGTFGEVGLNLLNLTDRGLAKAGVVPQDQTGGRSFMESLKRRFTEAQGGQLENKDYELTANAKQQENDINYKTKQEAEIVLKELNSLSKDQANKKYNQIKEQNPFLAKKIKDLKSEEDKGLSSSEKILNSMGVTNGQRAKYIFEKANLLKTKEEKNAYIKDLEDKGIISKNVKEQLRRLKEGKGI